MTRTLAPHALDEAKREQDAEAWSENRGQSGQDIDAHAHKKRRATPEPVGQRAEAQHGNTHAEHIGRNHELPFVLAGDAQSLAHIGQCRQHDVDCQRVEGHEGGHEGNEFGARENPREMIRHE
jgi:hypothetical protein